MRPESLNSLFREIESLKGVGPGIRRPLERLGLARWCDLAFHLPSGFVSRRAVPDLGAAATGEQVIVALTAKDYRSSAGRGPFRVMALDRAGNGVAIAYFGRGSGLARKQFPLGETRWVAGRLDRYGETWQIVHPDHVAADPAELAGQEREPVYPLSEGITSRRLAALAAQVLAELPELPEWIEPGFLAARGWPGWREALRAAHGGPDPLARERLAYDEVFANQLALALLRQSNRARRARPLAGTGALTDALRLPFALTGAQTRAIGEITGDMAQDRPMLRLLQGDVGAGKTVVALLAMLTAVEAGTQAALLAPTEILARQHAETLRRMATGLPVEIALLTGRDKGRAREATLMGVADGSVHILVGTHAIFQDQVRYRDLALTVIDEQHRFGVSQRLTLNRKGRLAPHCLAMTATPIPRTLTLSLYGEMDISRLDERPPGRQPVDTRIVALARMDEVIAGVERHLAGGGQAYWVCPMVTGNEDADLAAAEARHAMLKKRLGEAVTLVHGQMRPEAKDAAMEAFAAGRCGLLVATTVIEVGVDVPRASLMVIEQADRFGLAQLHQLRGRVGRGAEKSVCLLLRGEELSETARARLALMRETEDGFRIAEEDLRLRGGGEILGTRQSGEAVFRLADAEQVARFLPVATDDARLLIEHEGGLDGRRGDAARQALYLFERDAGAALLRGG